MAASLFEHETISTTIEKAKEVKPFAERLITVAKKGTLAARRQAISMLGDRDIVETVDGKPVRKGTVVGKLFSDLGPRYLDRAGGYTRIVRLSQRRLGDNGQLVLLQLLGADEGPKKKRRVARKRPHTRAEPATATAEPKVADALADTGTEPQRDEAEASPQRVDTQETGTAPDKS